VDRIRNFRFSIFDWRFETERRQSQIKNQKSKIKNPAHPVHSPLNLPDRKRETEGKARAKVLTAFRARGYIFVGLIRGAAPPGPDVHAMQGRRYYSFVFTFRFSFGEGRFGRSLRASGG
jgi:hypothetical protein